MEQELKPLPDISGNTNTRSNKRIKYDVIDIIYILALYLVFGFGLLNVDVLYTTDNIKLLCWIMLISATINKFTSFALPTPLMRVWYYSAITLMVLSVHKFGNMGTTVLLISFIIAYVLKGCGADTVYKLKMENGKLKYDVDDNNKANVSSDAAIMMSLSLLISIIYIVTGLLVNGVSIFGYTSIIVWFYCIPLLGSVNMLNNSIHVDTCRYWSVIVLFPVVYIALKISSSTLPSWVLQ